MNLFNIGKSMRILKTLLYAVLFLSSARIAVSDEKEDHRRRPLNALRLQAQELHASLAMRPMDDTVRHLPAGMIPPDNPYLSTDVKYLKAISRGGSQGRLDERGVKAVLYALYRADNELGFYALETESVELAAQREKKVREIWARNVELDRASVHRKGRVLLVVWTDGVSSDCWQAVNAKVAERLDIKPPVVHSGDSQAEGSAKRKN